MLILAMSFTALFATGVEMLPVFDSTAWKKLVCEIADRHKKGRERSVTVIPQVFYSDEYICVIPGSFDFESTSVVIADSEGTEVRRELIVAAGEPCVTVYIGDLLFGEYEVTFETDELVMTGDFDIK